MHHTCPHVAIQQMFLALQYVTDNWSVNCAAWTLWGERFLYFWHIASSPKTIFVRFEVGVPLARNGSIRNGFGGVNDAFQYMPWPRIFEEGLLPRAIVMLIVFLVGYVCHTCAFFKNANTKDCFPANAVAINARLSSHSSLSMFSIASTLSNFQHLCFLSGRKDS